MTRMFPAARPADVTKRNAAAAIADASLIVLSMAMLLLLESEGIERTSAANDDKLAAVQLVCDWRVSHSSNRRVPEGGSIAGAKGHCISGNVASEGQSAVRCENPAAEAPSPSG